MASAGRLDPGTTLQAIMQSKPDAIFNVRFGADLAKLVREGNRRNVFPKTPMVSMPSGEPEYPGVLKDERPRGWIVTGKAYMPVDGHVLAHQPPVTMK